MNEFMQSLDFWHWWVLGILLVILEMFSPGVFMLWMGIAAFIVGIIVWAEPGILWEWQLLIFALLSLLSIALARIVLKRHPIESEQPLLNRRGEQYVGRVFTLEEPIVNNNGKIRVDDSTWKVRGDDCEAGANVKVTGVDGVVLLVERTD